MPDMPAPSQPDRTPRRRSPQRAEPPGRAHWSARDDAPDPFGADAEPPLEPGAARLTLPSMPALPAARRDPQGPGSGATSTGRRPAVPRAGAGAHATLATGRHNALRPDASNPANQANRASASGVTRAAASDRSDRSGSRQNARPIIAQRQADHSAARAREQNSARPLWTTGVQVAVLDDDLRDQREDDDAYPAADVEAYEPEGATTTGHARALRVNSPGGAERSGVSWLAAPAPNLPVYRSPARPRVNTRALVTSARSPWSLTRLTLALLAMLLAVWTGVAHVGEPNQPLMAAFQMNAGAHSAQTVASLVKPQTQGMRPDLYDSQQQFNDWWDAACSPATMSEILTAWGVPNMSIGKMIDTMQPDVSLEGGLLTYHGFQRGADAFGYRADLTDPDHPLTYQQMLYITNKLGLPIIVNVRIAYGYYHFFDGGHFLVMTGGDERGVRIVDSSEYYITYLPLDTFYSMFTHHTAIIVPKDYHYEVPSV